jgi:YVTN family beta-propeller protein
MKRKISVFATVGLAVSGISCSALAADKAPSALPAVQGTVWVTNRTLNNVAVFEAATGNVLATIPTGRSSADVTVSQQAGKAYVTNEVDNSISVISLATRQVLKTIPVGAIPHHIKVTRDGRRVYFGEFGSNRLGFIDTSTDTFGDYVASANPAALSHSPFPSRDGRTVYVANEFGDEVVALDAHTGQIQFSIKPGTRPSEILATPDGRSLYISMRGENKLKQFDLRSRTIVREVAVGTQPDTLQLTPDGKTLVIGLRGQPAQVAFVDTGSFTLMSTVTIGGPETIAAHEWLSANGRYVFAVFEGPGAGLAVIDRTNDSVVSTLQYPGGGRPHGVFDVDPAAIRPAVAVTTRSARVADNVARVSVTCSEMAAVACRGRLDLTSRGHRLGESSFGLAAGRSETIAVRVDRSLGHGQRLSGRAVLTVTDGLANTARLSWPIELHT